MKVMATISRCLGEYELRVGESMKLIRLCKQCIDEYIEESRSLPHQRYGAVGRHSFMGKMIIAEERNRVELCIVCENLADTAKEADRKSK